MIQIDNLFFSYSTGEEIYSHFSLTINKGEAWTIIGPSGCGKSTLLFLIAGLNLPTAGSISICGKKITRPRPETGLILQDHGLLPWENIFDNALLGLKIRNFYGPDGTHSPKDNITDLATEQKKAAQWLHRLGLDQLQHKYPSQLSRGQRQRAAIARTLVLEPDLLLMDEPFSALDAPIRAELQKVMAQFHEKSQLTSVTVTHDIEEALLLGEKILVLSASNNTTPAILDNDLVNAFEKREDPLFLKRCAELRRRMMTEDKQP